MSRRLTPGEHLKVLRHTLHQLARRDDKQSSTWTQEEITKRGGPPQTSQSHIERGERPAEAAVVERLASGYGVTYGEMRRYLSGDLLLLDMILRVHPPVQPPAVDEDIERLSTPPSGRKKRSMSR